MKNKLTILYLFLFLLYGHSVAFAQFEQGRSKQVPEFKQSSVLKSGRWIKIRIDNTGIHRIKYATLKQWGFSNPEKVVIYGNGGKMLPARNSDSRPDDLIKCAAIHNNSSILFYGQGANHYLFNNETASYSWKTHDYDFFAYYFLIEEEVALQPAENDFHKLLPTTSISTFDDIAHFGKYGYNLLRSGKRWFSDRFDSNNKLRSYNFNFPDIVAGQPVKITMPLAARSSQSSVFVVSVNNSQVGSPVSVRAVNMFNAEGLFADDALFTTGFAATQPGITVQVEYQSAVSNSLGWLEYITVVAKSKLKLTSSQLVFRSSEQVNASGAAGFIVENAGASTTVWDVTSPSAPTVVKGEFKNGTYLFTAPAGSLREFVAFNPDGTFPEPQMVEQVANQDLHSIQPVNYLIVTHPMFLSEAQQLAETHIANQEISVAVVTTNQIYNEFSSGSRDVTAIRDFVRMIYKRSSPDDVNRLKYLLLFGDGSYNNKNDGPDNSNLIPTYQAGNSIHQSETYVSDDYFGYLDDHEGFNDAADRVDIGIGRFPLKNHSQAAVALSKSKTHLENLQYGGWKRTLLFIADDGDYNIHVSSSEKISNKVSLSNPEFEINKIYLDAYRPTIGSSGKSYPEVVSAIDRAVNSGALIFNYTGHGSGRGLSHEQVVTQHTIQSWTNASRLPLFVTATCEFARFDDQNELTAGEMVFLNPNGGGIALFTTTRIAYSNDNETINTNLFDYAFGADEDGKRYALGTIIQKTKNSTGTNTYKMNFTLLGDPALPLSYPVLKIETDSINGIKAEAYSRPLEAMSTNTLSGSIRNVNGEIVTGFNGNVTIIVYDKMLNLKTLGNESTPYTYRSFKNIIYKGNAKVVNGRFSVKFIIPKDIRYNVGSGRISYYAVDDEGVRDAAGVNNTVLIGGINDSGIKDKSGPDIKMWLNNEWFSNGQTTSSTPLLIAHLSDESGINTTGIGVGHDISLFIDGKRANPIILNEYFESDITNPGKGVIHYQIPVLSPGSHTIELRAWDILNNSSVASINFKVDNKMNIKIVAPEIFPNPVIGGTDEINLRLTHDDYDAMLNFDIEISNLSGQVVLSQSQSVKSEGLMLPEIKIGTRQLGGGIYLVRVVVTSTSGRTASFSKKIVVVK